MKKPNDHSNIPGLLTTVNHRHLLKRYSFLLIGLFLTAFAFNLFYAPYNIVTGSATGIGLIFREFLGLEPSLVVCGISLITLVLSLFFLDIQTTKNTIIGAILYPIMIKLTAILTNYIDLGNPSILLLMIYGGMLTGIGNGLMLNTGFSNGGLMVLYQIMHKYLKVSLGTANLIINSFIVLAGSYIFGLPNLFYAIITICISSYFTDRLLLGISKSKIFYIITNKEEEVKTFIMHNLHHSVTLLTSQGGFTKHPKKVIMCAIPTKEYYIVKEVITELDPEAFFLITDSYEVSGGI